MKKLVKSALACGLLCSAALMTAPAFAETDDKLPDLYEISDGDSSIFVYGTIHVLRDGTVWEKPELKNRIDNADRVLFELDVDAPDFNMQAAQAMQSKMPNTSGNKLSESLTTEELAELTELIAGIGMPAQMIDQFDPWVFYLQLANVDLVKMGLNPAVGVEATLQKHVAAAGKDIEGLETLDQQLNIFETTPWDEQVAALKSYLANRDQGAELINKMIAMWQQDQIDEIATLLNENLESSPALAQKLIGDRNANWVATFKDLLANDEKAFIAVGAGHLPGAEGVLTMMESAGYSITRH